MKKILATAICLIIGVPSFAMGNMGPYHPTPHNPAIRSTHYMPPHHKPHHVHHHRKHHHMSRGAKTAVAVAGVTGIALLIAAIAD